MLSAVPPDDPCKALAAAAASSKMSLGKPRTYNSTPRCASPCDDYLLVSPTSCAEVTRLMKGIAATAAFQERPVRTRDALQATVFLISMAAVPAELCSSAINVSEQIDQAKLAVLS